MAKKRDLLRNYRTRRNVKRSEVKGSKAREPYGRVKKGTKTGKPIFVIQEHDATHLHYDFRLEIDGVLKSWAIPKGPSTDPDVKRLAIPTDDHPMEYAQFEGVIPQGSYGAGPVIIWDRGTYANIRKHNGVLLPMDQCIRDGKVEVVLHGRKLKGGYVLLRMRGSSGKEQWLFKKLDDEYADARRNPVKTQPKSVVSGKTIKQMKDE